MKTYFKKGLLVSLLLLILGGLYYRDTVMRIVTGFRRYLATKDRINYYVLSNGKSIEDISQKLIDDKNAPQKLKVPLINGRRNILIFKYKSGHQMVAGYLSYIPEGNHPTMIFLRGGNGYFGIMRPNNLYSFIKGHNVIGTLYRGNLYGGNDEMGGADVADIDALYDFIPKLEEFLQKKLALPSSILGTSRGAMQMFAALSRYKRVQDSITHAISVSGATDLFIETDKRFEMKLLYQKKHQQFGSGTFDSWLQKRDPVSNVNRLAKKLKVLILYGTNDNLVFMEEQESLKKALDLHNIDNRLVIIPDGNHGLFNRFTKVEKEIAQSLLNRPNLKK